MSLLKKVQYMAEKVKPVKIFKLIFGYKEAKGGNPEHLGLLNDLNNFQKALNNSILHTKESETVIILHKNGCFIILL